MAKKDSTEKKEQSFLEKQLASLEKENMGSIGIDADEQQAESDSLKEQQEKIEAFKISYDAQKTAHEAKAKLLISETLKIYFTADMLSEKDYIIEKTKVDEMSLSNLFFQIDVINRAIYELSKKIHLGSDNSRHFEVLAGLSRVVLDTSKFQHEYVQSMESSLKRLREDIDIADSINSTSATEMKSDGAKFIYSDSKKMIEEMQNYMAIAKQNIIDAPSPNRKLNPNVEDIPYETVNDNQEDASTDESLETFGQ